MFKNILVASDGSKCGALDFSYDDLDDAGGAVLDEITAKGKEKDVVVVEHIITADPIQDMATMIRKINPDIAVFGAFGKSMDNEENIDYSKIGSVAENALKVSKVPVILVK